MLGQGLDDGDRLRGSLLGAALGEAMARPAEDGSPPDVQLLERRLRGEHWSLGGGMQAALDVGESVLRSGVEAAPRPLHLHHTGDERNLLAALAVALTGAFSPGRLRERVAALYADAPRESAEAALAFSLLLAAIFDGDRLAALDEAAEAAPPGVGMAMRSAPLEDADRLAASAEPLRSLVAGIWSFYQAEDAVEALLVAARTGIGALCGGICGALAGAWWGRSAIPSELASKLSGGPARLGDRLAVLLASATNQRYGEFQG
ncbi:MAG: hypothetical protein KGM44_11885 [bacterium]|nr:hypothetical protein [bacterium]